MIRLNWLKNADNVVYAEAAKFAETFEKELGISGLKEKIEDFDANPTEEGVLLKGRKRTSVRLFIPDLLFDEHIEMGENVWVYMGENYECYCLYNVRDRGYFHDAENFKFFTHRQCEYYPCHRTTDKEDFSCLFCYCPLYPLGRDCGGNYFYLDNGVKDCSGCMLPHKKGSYDYVMEKLGQLHEELRKKEAGV